MKRIFIAALMIFPFVSTLAQIKGVTETGDEVILYNDGTWKYSNDSITASKEIPVNDEKFTKSRDAKFLVKSKNLNIGVWLNPKAWSFSTKTDNEDAEFEFKKKDEDLYGMMITEKIGIPLPMLKNIALENASSVSPDIRIVKEEYRTVNDTKVLMLRMDGTIQGMKISYFGYYYSNENGTVQLLTFTSQQLFEKHFEEVEEFLNGFVEIN